MLYLNELILILCLQKWFYFCTSKRVIVLEVTGPELCFPFSVKKNSSQFSSLLCIFLGLFEENIYIYLCDKVLDISSHSSPEQLMSGSYAFADEISRGAQDTEDSNEKEKKTCLSAAEMRNCKVCVYTHLCIWKLCNTPPGSIHHLFVLDIQNVV